MKKQSLILLVVFIFSIGLDNTAIAKEKKASTKQKKKAEVVDTSPLVPFDINEEKLPPNYKGTDIAKLYSLLSKKAPLKKEEFDTTAEYEKKMKALKQYIQNNRSILTKVSTIKNLTGDLIS